MIRSPLAALAALTLLLGSTSASANLISEVDCTGFTSVNHWGGYAYGVLTVDVVALDGEEETVVDTLVYDAWKDFGTTALVFVGSFDSQLGPGAYRIDVDLTVYGNAYEVPTVEELAGWPEHFIFQFQQSSTTFYGCGPEVTDNCARTPGFWKNHAEDWPVDSLAVGGTTYSQDELLDIFDIRPRGNKSIKLAHHLIAAKLNLLENDRPGVGSVDGGHTSNVPSEGDDVYATIDHADDLLTNHDLSDKPARALGNAMEKTKDALDAFNNNELGTCSADDDSDPE